jgi:nicotinate-nucleotide adenylyltransferase
MSRVGVLGGSFDPVHVGHLVLAEEARERRGLDRVLFVPAARSPHKRTAPEASPQDRLRMVEAAIAGNPSFGVS